MNKLEKISTQREKASKQILPVKKKNDSLITSVKDSVNTVTKFFEKQKPSKKFDEEMEQIEKAKKNLVFYLNLITEKTIIESCKRNKVKEETIRKILGI